MRHVSLLIINILCICYSLFGQNREVILQVYEDSLNKFEHIAYSLYDLRLVEYFNECEE